ncbi:glycosyltransferase family 2 protein [Thermomonas sp.]|uniref:glycosyltransferase family A protein n=1 Tax=Thermomonas sp. TaxID=1971895 RepID=UPI00261379E5|nr:glycosyltransferase family 2 protein [Thermomonas sp.]
MSLNAADLPIVIVPIGTDEDALDACLAALESSTPVGTRVWLADDAQAGPRGVAIIERWLAQTRLNAAHTRRANPIGESRHLDEALRACGSGDVAVLPSNTQPTQGWLERLLACLRSDAHIAAAIPWCNAGETVAWPRIGEVVPMEQPLALLAEACAQLRPNYPALPAAVSHAVLLRGSARVQAGGLDAASFGSWYAALMDLSLRMAGLGGRSVLCDTAFVFRKDEDRPSEGDMDALSARWPAWNASIAQWLMRDPLLTLRNQLTVAVQRLQQRPPQQDLFTEVQ